MDTNPFIGIVEAPEPEFLRLLGEMPEPPFSVRGRIAEALPEINELFARKKQAVSDGDADAFDRITDEEVALLEKLED